MAADSPVPTPQAKWWSADDGFALRALLREIHDELAADAAYEAACRDCLQELQAVCSAALSGPEFKVAPFDWTPDVRLESFGSTQQGVALRSSDLDVRMTFEQFCVHGQERQLRYLKAIEAAPGNRLKVIRVVLARLPVLRLHFDVGLEVDLTMGANMDGAGDAEDGPDRYIAGVLDAAVDDGARQFVRLVKGFSKAQGLVDAHNGLLNSASWVCLALQFLQGQACLPSCSELAKKRVVLRRMWPVRPTVGLMRAFFAFVVRLGSWPYRLSVWQGTCLPVRNRRACSVLFVEHPSKDTTNLASCLSPEGWHKTVECCRAAKSALSFKRKSRLADVASELRRLFIGPLAARAVPAAAELPQAVEPVEPTVGCPSDASGDAAGTSAANSALAPDASDAAAPEVAAESELADGPPAAKRHRAGAEEAGL